MTPWRLVLGDGAGGLDAANGARNMAVDQTLLESVARGAAPVLRLYRWQPACLSFGRNQPTAGLYSADRVAAAGVDVVRRPTGGLAVLHDDELTYAVAAPLQLFGGPRAAYHAINRALVDGLRRIGVPASLAPAGRRRPAIGASADPCFQTPAAGEVVAGGRKLVGSAQRAEGGTLLQHGSILRGGSQARVLELQNGAAARASAVAGFVTLEELIGTAPSIRTLADAAAAGFEAICGTRLAPALLSHEESVRAAALESGYRDAAWTWRR